MWAPAETRAYSCMHSQASPPTISQVGTKTTRTLKPLAHTHLVHIHLGQAQHVAQLREARKLALVPLCRARGGGRRVKKGRRKVKKGTRRRQKKGRRRRQKRVKRRQKKGEGRANKGEGRRQAGEEGGEG